MDPAAISRNNPTDSSNTINVTSENEKKSIQKFEKSESLRISKNVLLIGLAFMLHFTAFHGTINLQSSVNSSAALGTTTLAVMYGSLILSNIFLPSTFIRWFGCKWAMAVSLIAYIPYIAAQFYPRFYTFIPAALLVGLGGGPLWCAKCTYLSSVAKASEYVIGNKLESSVIVVKFFGFFFVFYQLAQVWGNLISSTVLVLTSSNTNTTPVNLTLITTTNIIENATLRSVGELCGANFCPGIDNNVNPNLIPPEANKIHMLSGIFLLCMVIAVLLIIFGVDSLKRYGVTEDNTEQTGTLKQLAATIQLLSEKYQLLLLPITMFIGAEEAFVAVDFTASFVACGWGISRIGFAMICFGVANAIAAGIAGAVAELVGRISSMIAVFILHGALLIWMNQWIAVENDYVTYCVMAALWGICDGVWLVNVNAFCGILFPGKEIAAFGNFRLWESTGSVIGYALSPILCTSIKLKLLFGLMTIGLTGFAAIEVLERKEKGAVDRRHVELVSQQNQ